MHDDPSCIFCKICRGDLPSARVLETDAALAMLDINPVNPGHTLLLPRSHHATLSDLPDDLSAHLGSLLPRLCRAVRGVTGADGLNVVVNHGRAAGQVVDHVHWHIIPRHTNDAVRWPWPHTAYKPGEMDDLRARIAAALQPA